MASSFSSPWPDPNSPVLSKIDFGVPLVELFKWLDVRDTLLGKNLKKQDIKKALALARECEHPDAVWLTSIFDGNEVSTEEEAKKVLLVHENDARALCFAWLLSDYLEQDSSSLLRRASDMGYAFACSTLCEYVWVENKYEAFHLARIAAAQLERDGFSLLGRCFKEGIGYKQDSICAKENFLIAAELGEVYSLRDYGNLLDESDAARWMWLGRAALCGLHISFLRSFSDQVEEFFSGSGNANTVFVIGHALNGNIQMEKREIFGDNFEFSARVGPAIQAVSFYSSQIKSARLAVDTWTLVATRLHVIKDLRILIGKMIWEARGEANYTRSSDDGRK